MNISDLGSMFNKSNTTILHDIIAISERSNIDLIDYDNIPSILVDRLEAKYLYGARSYGEHEKAALATIEQTLNISLIRQYRVGKYRIDGYCKETNTAYEIDESGHDGKHTYDLEREQYIKNEIGCTFIRIKIDTTNKPHKAMNQFKNINIPKATLTHILSLI